jgi:hypothetical protein
MLNLKATEILIDWLIEKGKIKREKLINSGIEREMETLNSLPTCFQCQSSSSHDSMTENAVHAPLRV